MMLSRKSPETQKASPSSITPTTSCTHHSGKPLLAKETITSKIPLNRNHQPMIDASARKVHLGFESAVTPTARKIRLRRTWSAFHQPPCAAHNDRNSVTAATIAITPNGIEIAYTVVRFILKTIRERMNQMVPVIRYSHHALASPGSPL